MSAARALAALLLVGLVAACQAGGTTASGTPSQERPLGTPQAVVSDGDIDGSDGI